jgi:hypothetical protein
MDEALEALKNQRYGMLTNPLDMPPMNCELTELEVMQHLNWIDACTEGQQWPESIMKQCRRRFARTFRN